MKILTKNSLEKLNLAFWVLLLVFFIFFVNHQVITQVSSNIQVNSFLLCSQCWIRCWYQNPLFQVKHDLGHKWDVEHRLLNLNTSNISETKTWTLQTSAEQNGPGLFITSTKETTKCWLNSQKSKPIQVQTVPPLNLFDCHSDLWVGFYWNASLVWLTDLTVQILQSSGKHKSSDGFYPQTFMNLTESS